MRRRRREDEPGSGKLRPIGESLAEALRATGLDAEVRRAGVLLLWPKVVGAQIAGVTEPRLLTEDGTLVVGVKTHGWMNELSLMERQLIARLTATGAGAPVKRIRWELLR